MGMLATVKDLGKLDRSIAELCKKVESNQVETSSASADIASSHAKLLAAIQHLQGVHKEHEKAMALASARIIPKPSAMDTSSIKDKVEVLVKEEEEQMKQVRQEEAEVNSGLKKLVGMALTCGNKQTDEVKKMQGEVQKMNEDCEVVMEEIEKEVKAVQISSSKELSAILCSREKESTKVKETLKKVNSDEASTRTQAVQEDKEQTQTIVDNMQEVERRTSLGKDEAKKKVVKVEALATSLLEEKLKEYQPKGDTPVRSQSNYPRTIIEPVKKEQLVEAVRKRREVKKEKERLIKVKEVEDHDQSADSGVVSAASARPSFGAGSLADNGENMTKMEEPATPSKRGDLKEKRKLFGSSKSINSV